MTKIFAILDTETNQFVSYNSKCAWAKAGNAKNTFGLHNHVQYNEKRVKFDEQERYKIVELTESYFQLKDLKG